MAKEDKDSFAKKSRLNRNFDNVSNRGAGDSTQTFDSKEDAANRQAGESKKCSEMSNSVESDHDEQVGEMEKCSEMFTSVQCLLSKLACLVGTPFYRISNHAAQRCIRGVSIRRNSMFPYGLRRCGARKNRKSAAMRRNAPQSAAYIVKT